MPQHHKKALLTGITGQDGSFLAEQLLERGYEVHGLVRRASSFNTDRIDHLYQDPHEEELRLFLHYGDLLDSTALINLISKIHPDEVYNLGAQSHVRTSFDIPSYTVESIAMGTLYLLEAIRQVDTNIRFYQASSSEMFGAAPPPQNEKTPFYPRSPYACAKVFAYHQTVNYREAYGIHASNGILYNHESDRRSETFVTRKVTRAATRIKLGLQKELFLGNLEAKRDWGFAGDYAQAMHMIVRHDTPDDWVVATGESYSVREMVEKAFSYLDLDWNDHVKIDKRYFRPTEVDHLCGDSSKIRSRLGWEPRLDFDGLVKLMVDADMKLAQKELLLQTNGHAVRNHRD